MDDEPITTVRAFLRRTGNVTNDDVDAATRLVEALADDPEPDAVMTAVAAWRRIAAATSDDDPARAPRMFGLSQAMRMSFELTGTVDDLDDAVAAAADAVEAAYADDPSLAHYRANLAVVLRVRFDRNGDPADLDAAIDSFQQAVAELPGDDPQRVVWLQNLAAILKTRLSADEPRADLDRLIEVGGQIVDALAPDDPARGYSLAEHAVDLYIRFQIAGDPADGDAAVDLLRQAVEATPRDDPSRPGMLSKLADIALIRYQADRDLDDLDFSIAVGREALETARDGDPDRAGMLGNLSVALRNRFERTEVLDDLDAAIEFSERAVGLFAPDDTDRATVVFNLGAAQHIRYQQRHAPEDLDAALANLRRAVDDAPLGHTIHAMAWSSLGLALRSQFEHTGDLADLDAAVKAGQRALANLPTDAPSRPMAQANLDGTLIVRLRHTDVGDHAELAGLADRFLSWAAGAGQAAAEDPERGLAVIDELIDFCAGIPALAAGAAALGYNRAAVLRMLGRREEAEAAYREVVDEFATHPDPNVVFWAGLALCNTITLVVETSEPEAAVERVPTLVARLREQFAGHDHPLLAWRVRAAMRIEAELFESLGRAEQAAESLARLHDLLQPALEQVLGLLEAADPTEAVDDVTPRFAMERGLLLIPLLERIDESIDLVRELADAPRGDVIELVVAQHWLLSIAALQMLTAVKDGVIPAADGDEDRDRFDRGLSMLGSVFQYLAERPGEYPLGSGPIETLLGAVDASITMPDALEVARSAKAVGALSVPYVNALVEHGAMRLLEDGQWQQAARLQLLVLAAAERQPNCREGRTIVTIARFRWLYVARQVLINLPDGRVLHSARDAGERVLRAFESSGELEPGQLAEVLIALAALYIDPQLDLYTRSGKTLIATGYRRWIDRAGEYVLDPVEVPDDVGVAMPDTTEALDTAEKYLRRAMAVAEPVQQGHALKMLLDIHAIRMTLGVDTGEERLADLAARAVASIGEEAYPNLMAQALLARLAAGGQPDQAVIDRMLSSSVAEIAERVGAEVATGTLIGAGQLLRITDSARGRQLFADAEEFIRGLTERDRAKVLRVQQQLLIDPSDLEDGDPDPVADPKDASLALLKRAKAAGWPNDRTALALLALTSRGSVRADEPTGQLAWLTNLKVIRQLFADVFVGQADALAFLTASLYGQASGRAHERGDWEHTVRTRAAACAEYLALSLRDAAMESLTLIGMAVEAASGAGLARVAASALGPLVVRAENLIGAAATSVLQTIWSQVIGAVDREDQASALLACLQLAKGARFVDALRSGVKFDARADEPSSHLLELIGQIGDEPDKDLNLDAITLVTPYRERLDAGDMSLARQRENLERTFDASVQRHLTGEQEPRPLSIDAMLDLLPTDTVLLCIYLSHSPDGGRSLLSLVATKDRLAVVPNKVPAAERANQLTEVCVGDRVRVLDGLGRVAHRIRSAVLAEPGPVRPVARSDEAALADGLPGLFGPVTDLLLEEYVAGRRHLVIVPHGGLHFAPLHLLYLGGRPIADTWTVSYLPNIAMLERAAAARDGECTVTSVGLGFAGGPLPPIPEAVEEAGAVAAEFGTTALLDEHASKEAVLAALGSARLFHIATHGVHNVAAPAFQSLYVADERVNAYELLRLDLSGLDLVTLSACETGLGRFDAADNLRGIPASLLLRGVSAIVGTLWPVETRTSRDFFTTLYQELRRGRSRLDAFTEAQHRTRAAHPQYRDWGAFYYTGDWR